MDGFPGRPRHEIPGWVQPDATYHIRIRADRAHPAPLIQAALGQALLQSVGHYHQLGRWQCCLALLMPDHLHALIAFPRDQAISAVVGGWKGYAAKHFGVRWQPNYFDHRIRHRHELQEKFLYILRNPVVKQLCAEDDAWPWVFRPQ